MGSIKIQFSNIVYLSILFPLLSIFSCVVMSMWLHWDDVTATHCKVVNYFPSISAAVDKSPEKYIWRIAIGLHSFQRYLIAFAYYHFYQDSLLVAASFFRSLVKFAVAVNLLEITSLILLTYVSSTDNYEFHKWSFIGFILFSFMFMVTTSYLFLKLGRIKQSKKNYFSLRQKMIFLTLKLMFFFLTMYFFVRHNKNCEPGIYSLFALCEYAVVTLNILFHGTALIDFRGVYIEIPINGIQCSTSKHAQNI
ncbi:post-GPI attachment to proteins factor 2 isoform X1 [Hydra vulgaris]|nr:post-GPI attachment to proteins factor 2 [Hydra vulgaris]